MSAKPVTVPAWATNTNYSTGEFSGTPTKVAPSAGVRQDGHVPDTAPGAQHENYDRGLIGDWLQYLNDGDLEGPHSITNSAAASSLFVTHSDTTTAGVVVNMPSGAALAAGLFEGGLEVTAGDVVTPRGFRQRADAPLAQRDTDHYRYCDVDGAITQPERTIMIPLSSAVQNLGLDGNWQLTAPGGSPTHAWSNLTPSVSDRLLWEPRLPQGAFVTQVRVGVKQETDNATDMTLEVFELIYDKVDGGTSLASTTSSLGTDTWTASGATTDDILAVSGLTHTVTSGNGLLIQITGSAGSPGGIDFVYWVEVTFEDPGPRNF